MLIRGNVDPVGLMDCDQRKGQFTMGVFLNIIRALFSSSSQTRTSMTVTKTHQSQQRVSIHEILPPETVARIEQSIPAAFFARFEEGIPAQFLAQFEHGMNPEIRSRLAMILPADVIEQIEHAVNQRAADQTGASHLAASTEPTLSSEPTIEPAASMPEATIPQASPWIPDAKITGDDPWHPGQTPVDNPWNPGGTIKGDDPWHPESKSKNDPWHPG